MSLVSYFHPRREFKLDRSEFVYNFDNGKLKRRCHPEGYKGRGKRHQKRRCQWERRRCQDLKSALTTSKKRMRSTTAHTAVTRPVWTVTMSVRKEEKRRQAQAAGQ